MKLTTLMCFLKMSSDLDNLKLKFVEFGPNERAYISQAVFALRNSSKSGCGKIRIFEIILRIGNNK